MTKSDRLFHILNLLRSRKSLNAARLAEECGVSERSIYRDIISLSEAHVPIYYDRGYKFASDNFLPPLNFNFDEYTGLKLALESSPLSKTGKYKSILKQVRAKIDSGLSGVARARKRTARDTAVIDIETTSTEEQAQQFYSLIEKAASDQTCLDIEYESIHHGVTLRRVEPYFIVFRSRAFYIVAYCQLRRDFRTFRIDRILACSPTDVPFKRQEEINPRDYFEGSWRIYSGEPVEVVIRFTGASARVVELGVHHPREDISHDNGDVIYRVTVNGIEEIQRWILGFGSDAKVMEPASLRSELQRIGQYLGKTYSSD